MSIRKRTALLVAIALVLSLPAFAESNDGRSTTTQSTAYQSSTSEIGWHGWGVRFGMASDADQVLVGAQANLGEFTKNLRFQPDLEYGSGDDATTLFGTAPVYYRFNNRPGMTPYAGGGIAMGYVEVDAPDVLGAEDESSFEVGVRATGGLEWDRGGDQSFFVELSLGFGDVHDARLVGAWQF